MCWSGLTCYVFYFASTGWEQRVMFFFSRVMPTQVPEINATCFFFEHVKWAEIHVYLFFILARLRRAKFPFPACIFALARLRRANFLEFLCFFALVCLQHAIFLRFVSIFALAHRWHALTCMFFSRLFGAPAAVDVLCFFFSRRWPELTCYVFFFAGFCKFGRNYRVMFFFRGHLRKIITLWFFEALRKKKHNTSK